MPYLHAPFFVGLAYFFIECGDEPELVGWGPYAVRENCALSVNREKCLRKMLQKLPAVGLNFQLHIG